MAFDGITIANIVKDLQDNLIDGRLSKIAQPEPDELLCTIKGKNGQQRLCLSASASLPLIYLTRDNKPSPMTAPNFCMLLRKHVQNARIVSISQPGLERIVIFELEHLDELGDLRRKKLIVEIMGKHSNIIFCDEDNKILDSIKHISGLVSSVREVLPGKPWFIPHTQEKFDPLTADRTLFMKQVFIKPCDCFKALYTTFTGLSPAISHEICFRAGGHTALSTAACTDADKESLWNAFSEIITQVKNAITLAREEHCADSLLEVFFRTAVTAAKKIKTTLRFTRSEASVATKTLEILQNAPDAPRNVLVIGNGEIGRLVCSRLLEQGFSVSMTLRQYKHGQIQVPEGAESFDYALRYQEMPRFDALVSATSSPHYTVDWAEFSRLAKAPRYLIDLAVPRDIDPACGEKAALYDIDTLGREEFTRERAVLLQQAQQIVEKYRQDLHIFYGRKKMEE